MTDDRPTLTIGHSPDPDDAFMWWPLVGGDDATGFDTGRFRYDPVPRDIESLNRLSLEGELEITAYWDYYREGIESLSAYQDLGVHRLLVNMQALRHQDSTTALERFADEVVAKHA